MNIKEVVECLPWTLGKLIASELILMTLEIQASSYYTELIEFFLHFVSFIVFAAHWGREKQ